jgi:hypothetical protein
MALRCHRDATAMEDCFDDWPLERARSLQCIFPTLARSLARSGQWLPRPPSYALIPVRPNRPLCPLPNQPAVASCMLLLPPHPDHSRASSLADAHDTLRCRPWRDIQRNVEPPLHCVPHPPGSPCVISRRHPTTAGQKGGRVRKEQPTRLVIFTNNPKPVADIQTKDRLAVQLADQHNHHRAARVGPSV